MPSIVLGLIVAIPLVMTNCYYNSEEELYITLDDNCDTLYVTYDATIQPILQNRCLGCHGSSNKTDGDGNDFRDFNNVRLQIDNIIGALSHDPNYSPMPKDLPMIPSCEITEFKKWKEYGFPKN